jgi:hypothetical protein
MRLNLSEALERAGMRKIDYDARRRRKLLGYALNDAASDAGAGDFAPALADEVSRPRARYTRADVVALAIFEKANSSMKMPNELIDYIISNQMPFIRELVDGDSQSENLEADLKENGDAELIAGDFFIGASGLMHGNRTHFHGSLAEISHHLTESRRGFAATSSESMQIILLNVSATHAALFPGRRLFKSPSIYGRGEAVPAAEGNNGGTDE